MTVSVGAFGADRSALVAANVDSALARLGGNVDEWAAALASNGVTGAPGDAASCPLAIVLSSELTAHAAVHLGGPVTVTVDSDEIIVNSPDGQWHLDPTDPVRDFVSHFDDGAWPGLVTRAPAATGAVRSASQRFAPELNVAVRGPYASDQEPDDLAEDPIDFDTPEEGPDA